MSRVSLDTSVLIEYIDLSGSSHREAEAVIQSIINGKLTAIIPHPVLAETFYVSTRIYEELGFDDAEDRAEKLVEWLYRSPNFVIAEHSLELAALTGKIKRKYGLALTDAYVLASSKIYQAKALFRAKEDELKRKFEELSREYNILFLKT